MNAAKYALAFGAILFFASTSFGDPIVTTVSITFQVGSGTAFGGVYVNPYTATIGGSTTQVFSDDWAHQVAGQETWTATAINLASAGTSSPAPQFAGHGSVTTQQLYDAVAFLAGQILANPTPSTEIQDSYAIWDLTCQYETPTCSTSVESAYSTAGGSLSALQLLESQALSTATTASAAGWEVLTPIAGTYTCPTGVTCPSAGPQEFLVYTTPEPSSVALVGIGLLGLLGFARPFRRARPLRS